MASLSISAGINYFTYQITGLSEPFNLSHYTGCGLSTKSVAFDSSYPPSGNVPAAYKVANEASTSKSTPLFTVDYSPGTYTFYAYTRAKNKKCYPAGSSKVTVRSAPKYTLKVSKGTGIATATVGGNSSQTEITQGSSVEWKCSVSSGYAFRGWYKNDDLYHSSTTFSETPTDSYRLTAMAWKLPSFSLTVTGASTIKVTYTPNDYRYYKVWYRKTSETAADDTGWLDSNTSSVYNIAGLEAGTSYTVNITYSRTKSGGALIGAKTATTLAAYTCAARPCSGCDDMYTSLTVSDGARTESSLAVLYNGKVTWSVSVKQQHVFIGWFDNAAGSGSAVSTQAQYSETITSNRTLYAKIKINTYSAKAYSSGYGCCFSSVYATSEEPTYGSTIKFIAKPNPGYEFAGWYKSQSASTPESTLEEYPVRVTKDITLYARGKVKWTHPKSPGSYAISAEEWRRLQTFVEQRKGVTFSRSPQAGEALTATLYNDMAQTLGISGVAIRGQPIYASKLNALITSANKL